MSATALLIGAGGTGTHLLPALSRLLAYHPAAPKRLIVMDGDTYEPHNAERQLGYMPDTNKAAAAVDFLITPDIRERLEVVAEPKYADTYNVGVLLAEHRRSGTELPFIVLCAVDNHATRKMVLDMLDQSEMPYLYISPGNDFDTGRVLVFGRTERKEPICADPREVYPDIGNPTDRRPSNNRRGCFEEQESTPQLITANAMAATLTLHFLECFLSERFIYSPPSEMLFDLKTHKVKAL